MKVVKMVLVAVMIVLLGFSEVIAQEAFELKVPLPLTGKNKKFGEIIQNSAILALEEFNATGGFKKGILKGKQFKMVFEDDGTDPAKVLEIVNRLIIEEKQPVILGVYGSDSSWEAAQATSKLGIPFIVCYGAANKIGEQGWTNIFRIQPPAKEYLGGLTDFLKKVVEPKTVAILYEPSSYGKSTAESMRTFCAKEGLTVVHDASYDAAQTDFRQLLMEVRGKNPDVVFMVSYNIDGILLMKQSMELKLNPKIFAGGAAGFVLPNFTEQAGAAAENVVTSNLWAYTLKYPGAKEFAEKYKERYGEYPSYHGALSYSSITVLVDALERTVSLAPADIIAALDATNIMTVFGLVEFTDYDGFTNQNKTATIVMQVQNGKLVSVWPEAVAETKYIYPVPKW
ncbi:MAG: ABC transporter substrate-binding protein [Candidatus Omnitrophota bacterium]